MRRYREGRKARPKEKALPRFHVTYLNSVVGGKKLFYITATANKCMRLCFIHFKKMSRRRFLIKFRTASHPRLDSSRVRVARRHRDVISKYHRRRSTIPLQPFLLFFSVVFFSFFSFFSCFQTARSFALVSPRQRPRQWRNLFTKIIVLVHA